ncbi:hypothetical protein CIHG_08098 [Coccidioides immitis H538.4]|uniref:Uncharacterized protein n=1 Tax=Coccidioides immitis H538.4 TaxID=396776 RepID=A0A0J8S1Q2_COCIT|nr:hypothetical protein CIHG_08098 [Coccidioides immitis H538.4]
MLAGDAWIQSKTQGRAHPQFVFDEEVHTKTSISQQFSSTSGRSFNNGNTGWLHRRPDPGRAREATELILRFGGIVTTGVSMHRIHFVKRINRRRAQIRGALPNLDGHNPTLVHIELRSGEKSPGDKCAVLLSGNISCFAPLAEGLRDNVPLIKLFRNLEGSESFAAHEASGIQIRAGEDAVIYRCITGSISISHSRELGVNRTKRVPLVGTHSGNIFCFTE